MYNETDKERLLFYGVREYMKLLIRSNFTQICAWTISALQLYKGGVAASGALRWFLISTSRKSTRMRSD